MRYEVEIRVWSKVKISKKRKEKIGISWKVEVNCVRVQRAICWKAEVKEISWSSIKHQAKRFVAQTLIVFSKVKIADWVL